MEFSNADAVQEVQPLTIVLYDLLNIPNDDQLFARQQFLKFLDALPKGGRIALFTCSNGIPMVDYTLAYRPTNESWDGRFRSIQVDAKGAGSLTYCRGYCCA